MSADRLLVAYTGTGQTGTAGVLVMDNESRYFGADPSSLYDMGLYETISSLRSYATGTPTTWILLDQDYYGNFFQITNASDSISDVNVPSSFNNKARSIIGIRRDENEIVHSLKSLLTLSAALGGVDVTSYFEDAMEDAEKNKFVKEARLVGDIVVDWAAFPEGVSGLSRSKIYPRVWQRMEFDMSTVFFKTYSVTVSFYLSFYVWHGRVVGRVEAYDAFVEDGTLKGILEMGVGNSLGLAANDLSKSLAKIGDEELLFGDREYESTYYLPGTSSNWSGSSAAYSLGDSGSDVMIVASY